MPLSALALTNESATLAAFLPFGRDDATTESLLHERERPRREESRDAQRPRALPEHSQEWSQLEVEVLQLVRRELGSGLRRRLESMDVVQEVMSELVTLSSDEDFQVEDFRAWLRSVVKNRVRDLADYHNAHRRAASREAAESDPGTAVTGQVGPVDQTLANLDYERLLEALRLIDETSRTVIVLRSYKALSHAEIAVLIGKPSADAARMTFARAMSELTRQFHRLAEAE